MKLAVAFRAKQALKQILAFSDYFFDKHKFNSFRIEAKIDRNDDQIINILQVNATEILRHIKHYTIKSQKINTFVKLSRHRIKNSVPQLYCWLIF